MLRSSSSRAFLRGVWVAALALLACLVGHGAAAEPLLVDGRAAIAVWPAVTLLIDPSHALTLAQVLARPQQFTAPTGTVGNLGRTSGAVWLRIPIQVLGTNTVERVLEIDYPALNLVEVAVVRDGRALVQHRLGNSLRLSERPQATRSHAVSLTLAPGQSELLLRVVSVSSMVLPITLRTTADFTAQESRSQLQQGAIAGVAMCMLLYILAHWVGLRDPMFLQYAVMLGANMLFTLTNFGLAAQYLWPDQPNWSMWVPPLAVLLAAAAGTAFMCAALQMREISRANELLTRAIGMLALACIVAVLMGLMEYRTAQLAATVIGLAATLVVLPVCCVRVYRGEPVAVCILIGWVFYVFGTFTMAGMIRGHLEPTPSTQYIYPLSTMVQLAAWMAVLVLRVQSSHRNADRARAESEIQRSLAHTDALTGLPNRRGLQDRLAAALGRCNPQQLLAVYLLDLDGFKPVNDHYGHDVGDALLVALGRRLQAQLRSGDVVVRLGGDEFVVLASGLADESVAHVLGQKLLASVSAPFEAAGQRCTVGLTIGYALAPLDGSVADDLIKRADAAMYAGKQSGRGCMQRGDRVPVTA